MFILLSSCATGTVHNLRVKKDVISIKNFINTCGVPSETYFIKKVGVKVHRHRNCMGVSDLLSLAWLGERSADNINGINMLAYGYVTHLNRKKTNNNYFVKPIKIEHFFQEGRQINVAFFEIINKTESN